VSRQRGKRGETAETAHSAGQPLAEANPGASGLGDEPRQEHSMLVIFYHMLKDGTTYAELAYRH